MALEKSAPMPSFVQQIDFSSKIDYNWTKREATDERSSNEIV